VKERDGSEMAHVVDAAGIGAAAARVSAINGGHVQALGWAENSFPTSLAHDYLSVGDEQPRLMSLKQIRCTMLR
jgi:hypothetical protein